MAAPNSFGAFGAVGSTMGIEQELVDLTSELVAIPSVSDDAARREAVIAYVEGYCRALPGVHVERLTCNGFPSLVAAFDDRRHKALVLNAHLDVVPARPEQFKPHVRDGKLYGRGAQDMKGAAAAFLLVLKTLAESGRHPSVAWQFVSDEEIGGDDGSGYLLQSGYTTDFFLAGEPTDLSIVNRAKGVLWVEVQQIGNPAHGSRPWDGDNPLVALAGGIERLLQRYPIPEQPAWRTTITPAALHGGDAQNRVPADALLKLDIRRVPDDDAEAVLDVVRECFPNADVVSRHTGSALATRAGDPQILRLQAAASSVTGREHPLIDEHFASDARYYSEAGIPAVCFGPAGAGLHSHEEWVDVAGLVQFYQVIMALCHE